MSENSESRQHDGKASLPTLVRLTRAIDPSTVPIALRKAWVLRLPYPPGSGTMPAVQRLLKRFQADHGADVLRHVKTIRKTEDEGVPARMDAVLAYQAETGDLATEEEVVSLIKKYQPDLLGEKSAQADAEGARGPVIRALDIPTTPIPTRSRIAEWNAFWPCVLRITGPADAPISDASAQKAANSVSLTSSSTSIDFIDRARDARMWTENTARLQWAKDGFQACLRLARQAQAKGDLPIGAYVMTAVEGSNAGMEGMLPAFAHDTRISSNHPLRHAVLNIIRAVADGRAALKIRSDKLAELEQDGISNLPTQADSIPAEQFDEGVSAPAAPAAPAGNGTDYLLSSLTLFTTHEPCAGAVGTEMGDRICVKVDGAGARWRCMNRRD
ncbi:hypothetical protein A4X06_0g995 [Tilletia controversa]|uniref:CMP/dCMP-type deaminase domain-containing protein n=1 Tax=Tilletia controversa TaxID=13291 RepID=A0A8X7T077_9BASI|nr:hypothetical protein CF328_g893 [Tilletia controversa]KAE8254243.1 hypothetical protein A4X06_0g995 [Tilletia controversa]